MMMRDDAAPAGRGKMLLTAALIAANLLMLAAGIITIPANFRETTGGGITSDGSAVAKAFSTEERPDLEDFLWYTQGVYYDGLPSDADIIEDFAAITGGWKGIIFFDPENQQESRGMEFVNVIISGSTKDLKLTLDWCMAYFPDEGLSIDETDDEDMVYTGSWDGGLAASANSTVYLPQFYELNQKQYAVGSIDTVNDIPAYIALVRP